MSFSKTYALDAAPGLVKREPGQAALTSTAYVGSQHDQLSATATDCVLVVNVESVDKTTGDETYKLRVVGSNVANRSDGEVLACIEFGDASALSTPETRDSAVGDRFIMPFRTEKNRTWFRYVDLHLTVAGTTPSAAFNAYISKEL